MTNLNTLSNSVKTELSQHILDYISDGVIDNDNNDECHFHCFNENHYIIGYFQATEWLKEHNIDAFEAIGICQDYEKDVFGEMQKKYDNSEVTVNMLAYILGEELLNDLDCENIEDLTEAL